MSLSKLWEQEYFLISISGKGAEGVVLMNVSVKIVYLVLAIPPFIGDSFGICLYVNSRTDVIPTLFFLPNFITYSFFEVYNYLWF